MNPVLAAFLLVAMVVASWFQGVCFYRVIRDRAVFPAITLVVLLVFLTAIYLMTISVGFMMVDELKASLL